MLQILPAEIHRILWEFFILIDIHLSIFTVTLNLLLQLKQNKLCRRRKSYS